MYDRYTIASDKSTLERVFQVKMPDIYLPNYNAIPTDQTPVITATDRSSARLFYWGLAPILSNNKSISSKLFNLPAFSAFQRPLYRRLIEQNRCVILSDGFYLWKQLSKKQKAPYFCYYANRTPFAIAGVWEQYEDLDGNTTENFNMITVSSTHDLRDYQEDMPAILNMDYVTDWLNPDLKLNHAEALLKKINADGLRLHAVSPILVNTRINDERLIKPATPSDQFGNYTLF